MANYTIQLRSIMNSPMGAEMLKKALSSYPLYSSESQDKLIKALIPTREELNQKILNHYRWYEIGFCCVDEFIEELEITMNEIMPYYNQLYKSVETMTLIEDPFGNVDVTETIEETRENTSKSDDKSSTTSKANDSSSTISTNDGQSKNVKSDTPQGNISKTASEIDSVTHADNVEWNKTKSDGTATTEGESSSEAEVISEGNVATTDKFSHTFHKKGNQGVNTYAHDMEELRKTFIDVTVQIINDKRIKELFMLVY